MSVHLCHAAQEGTVMGKMVSGNLLVSARDEYNNENTEWVLRSSDTGYHFYLLCELYCTSY
jgi:hypothetical protein